MGTDELLSAVTASVGIYGTQPTAALSALARVEGFSLADLERAIAVDRTLVRVRAMRYSAYLLPRALLIEAFAATRRQALKLNAYRRRAADQLPDLRVRIDAALAGGPLPAVEIRTRVDPDRRLGELFSGVLGVLAAEGRIVRAATTGGWRSDRLTYARWADWLPDVDPAGLDQAEARRRLAARYVAAYGPVTLDDLRWWAGWTVSEARTAADGLDLEVVGGAAALVGEVRLLPVWDVLLVAYRHRGRLLDPASARFVYDASGNATSVVLDAGRVVGVWDLGRSDDPLRLRVAPLGTWPSRRWDDVEAQAHRIATLIGAERVEVSRVGAPVDLTTAARNRFLSPLSGPSAA